MKIAEGAAVAQGGSYLELMEQAGAGAAEGILTLVDPAERETLILCGKGNNGFARKIIALTEGVYNGRRNIPPNGEPHKYSVVSRKIESLFDYFGTKALVFHFRRAAA